jgi:Tol biopolymer transport system component
MRRLTFGGTLNQAPIWSADGEYILFRSNREGDIAVYRQPANGTGSAERLTKPEPLVTHGEDSWVPKEQKFLFVTLKGPDTMDVFITGQEDIPGDPNCRDSSE